MIIIVLLIITGALFLSSVSEKKVSDVEKAGLQAMDLAEAGAFQGVTELRKRVKKDLSDRVGSETNSAVFQAYITTGDSLSFLRDWAYATGNPQFSISGSKASLLITPLSLSNKGSFSTNIEVKKNGEPTNPSAYVYEFPYKFEIVSSGTITQGDISKNVRLAKGQFKITVQRGSFARFALFTEHHKTEGGTTVWFSENTNFTGPVSTNERFSFANNPGSTFTKEVRQVEDTARFYNNGSPVLVNSDHYLTRDVPTFQEGFSRGVDPTELPTSVTESDMKAQVLAGQAEPGSNGIYIVNDGTNVTGGIYIRGNSTVSMGLGAGNNPKYTIVQGASTNNVVVNYATNSTEIDTNSDGVADETYVGTPDGAGNEGIIIYDRGSITNLSGTVQQDTQMTVASSSDLVIGGNVMYQDYTAGSTPNANGTTNLLGIISWGGDVRIGAGCPNNVNIHGIVMAPADGGEFKVDNYNTGSSKGTATLLGGAIVDYYGAFGTFDSSGPKTGYGRNFVYDPRMLSGMAPPYFPVTTRFVSSDDGGLSNKLIWKEE